MKRILMSLLMCATFTSFMPCANTVEDSSFVQIAEPIPAPVTVEKEVIDVAEEIEEEPPITVEERDLLAKLVWYEAQGEDLLGKQYVVDVVLNRVDSDLFPDTITDVIYEKNQFSTAKFLTDDIDITEDCYEAVDKEVVERLNTEILYFNCNCNISGTYVFNYGGHWFGK